MSSKLMKMKFMSTAADKAADAAAADEESKKISESHWRLSFRDGHQSSDPPKHEVDASYTSFANLTSGRRQFGRQKEPEEEDEKEPVIAEDEDEAPEDMFARREAAKEADRASLRAMKGMTSLSGGPAAAKRKNNGPKSHGDGNKKRRN